MLSEEIIPETKRRLRRPLNMRADTRVAGVLYADREIFSPPITRITVPNARVVISNTGGPRGGHVFTADGMYVDANLSHAPIDIRASDADWEALQGRWSVGIPLRGRGNFSHFLLEGVPNGYCGAIFDRAPHCNIISDSLQNGIFREFGDLVSSATTTLHPAPLNAAFEVEELRMLRGLKHPLNNADERIAQFMRSIAQDSSVPGLPSDRIAVLRRPGRRGVANLNEVLSVLNKYDFEVVFPEDYPLSRQVSMFARAGVVLGIHGAAMSNIVFCQSSAANPVKIIEVAQPTYLTPAFWILSECLSMDYRLIFSEGESKELDRRTKFNDLVIPVDAMHSVIRETLGC